MTQTHIWWIRRDLRLHDNPALSEALAGGASIIPLFILEPDLMHAPQTGAARRDFLLAGLKALDDDLRRIGGRLILRTGEARDILPQVMQQSGASTIFTQDDLSPYAERRMRHLPANLPIRKVGMPTLRHPDDILSKAGKPYTVFTPYKRAWLAAPLPSRDDLLHPPKALRTPEHISGQPLPKPASASTHFPAGEAAARQRMAAFIARKIEAYGETRDRLDLDGTSRLSPYLRFGMLSAREVVVCALEAAQQAENPTGADTWLSELIWREFYNAILYHYPGVLEGNFRPQYNRIRWLNREEDIRAWQEGATGFPVVDAAMAQLRHSGWMHNRARMIVASFLVKDLLVNWRIGERWFMEHLIDGDPAANNGGWQWSAGTGTDAAPYFRIFNPVRQSKRFDPHGAYIRRWLPALQDVPNAYIHTPWQMPEDVQRRVGCRIGVDYPAPVIDHAFARQRALAAYAAARQG